MSDVDAPRTTTPGANAGVRSTLREWVITGAALTIPFLITVMVLAFVLNFVSNLLTPVVDVARYLGLVSPMVVMARSLGLGPEFGSVLIELGTILALLVIVLGVGIVATHTSSEREFSKLFHTAMEAIPGVGSVYTSFRRMSDVLIESDTSSFQEVKLIEFPNEGTYSFAFVTAEPPASVDDAANHDDLRTLFMPLAPNPVMGGFLVHVPAEQVYDVDLSVEEAVSAIVTSGVAIGDTDGAASLSADELRALGRYSGAGQVGGGGPAGADGAEPTDTEEAIVGGAGSGDNVEPGTGDADDGSTRDDES